ncbi:hypothetical protein Tco_0322128 [Tanacetum coccineum]
MELKNSFNKLKEEGTALELVEAADQEKSNNVSTHSNNDNDKKHGKEVTKEAEPSSSKPKLSFGLLDLSNFSDSDEDEDEVFASQEEHHAYLASIGGGHQMEQEDFDLYDDDYADQIRDLPGQIKAFHDFQLHSAYVTGFDVGFHLRPFLMCEDLWGQINFARAIVEIVVDSVLKNECPKRVKPFTNSDKCPKTVKEPVIISTMGMNNDGFMEVKRKNNKGRKVKGTSTSNSFDALKNMDIRAEDKTSSSRSTHEEDSESELKTDQCDDLVSDDEVDEYIFPEDDKFGDKFDIRLKGRVRK